MTQIPSMMTPETTQRAQTTAAPSGPASTRVYPGSPALRVTPPQAMRRIRTPLALLLAGWLLGCSPQASSPEPPPPSPGASPTLAQPEESAREADPDEPQALAAEPPPARAPERSVEEILAVWINAGATQEEGEPADRFAPTPPGAQAQTARFTLEGGAFSVAVFLYPSERFAHPHHMDVRERIRLLPQRGEAVVASGGSLVHLVAADAATARREATRAATALGWPIAPEDLPNP